LARRLRAVSTASSFTLFEHIDWRECDIIEHCEMWEKVEALEHHADLFADVANISIGVGDTFSIDIDLARIKALEAVNAAEQGALA